MRNTTVEVVRCRIAAIFHNAKRWGRLQPANRASARSRRSHPNQLSWNIPMDRRTWLQLLTLLAAARPAAPQPPQGRASQQPPQPLRVTKEQVQAALKLFGLEFE